MVYYYMILMRPRQWLKNIIIFAGLLFSKKFFETEAFINSLIAFFLFSFIASCQYVVNDYLDRKEDAVHPEKMHRPLASGKIEPGIALSITIILIPILIVVSYRLNPFFFFLVSFYFLFNLLYSKYLKHMVILDVMSISLGFIIRAIAGAVVVGVNFSNWLLLCTFMLSLFWGFSKRRGELILLHSSAGTHRKILQEYSPGFLDLMMGITGSMTIMSYVMYTLSPDTMHNLGTDKLFFTIPVVVYAIFRSLYIIFIKNMGHSPTEAILKDKNVLFSGLLWTIILLVLIYKPFAFLK
ncbi:MAG: decaprenyl-phosphate phosphoribosyltransferase [Leptospiraceae bacterium]|nr:decaprenyl-phosphate phosphoribosyltransferase [Leptospiraceae bacterium]